VIVSRVAEDAGKYAARIVKFGITIGAMAKDRFAVKWLSKQGGRSWRYAIELFNQVILDRIVRQLRIMPEFHFLQ
jgi:hypothetical protein